ncbi:integrase arm-type DNA-binding domain-containing protein [Nostoc sp. NIES-2111]
MAPRTLHKLSAKAIANLAAPGRHGDGGGLYLSIDGTGRRRWVFLFRWQGKLREMGLGPARDLPLSRARELAAVARRQLAEKVSPLDARRREKPRPTFGEAADDLLGTIEAGFRKEKHRAQWKMTLERYCATIRDKRVDQVTTEDVLGVLKPIWLEKNETASRLRGRIERVLDAARAKGQREGDNPARWKGHLDALLPARQKLQRGHHAAMRYQDVAAFLGRLRAAQGVSARALEFAILTAARSGEVLGATWAEIDEEAKVWTVPAARMKAGREHRVPLGDRALALLSEMREQARLAGLDGPGAYVFPGGRRGKPLSSMALEMQMRRLKVEDATPHGFRSAFRDWAGEETAHPREVAEAALAHIVGDEVERAYRRGDALAKRRALMEDWEKYLLAATAT